MFKQRQVGNVGDSFGNLFTAETRSFLSAKCARFGRTLRKTVVSYLEGLFGAVTEPNVRIRNEDLIIFLLMF